VQKYAQKPPSKICSVSRALEVSMEIDPRCIFKEGRLLLWDSKDLEEAEVTVNPLDVTSLRIGAQCYSVIGIAGLLTRLEKYSKVTSLVVADDRIKDDDMAGAQASFTKQFTLATFKWTYDGLAGGKHGR
jgi:hypothetical protein